MSSSWEDFINSLKDDSLSLAKGELINLVKTTRDDSEEFLKRQGEKLELYLKQLAVGEITKKQFAGYVEDIKALTEMHALKMSVAAKARAQKLAWQIGDLILNKLVALL
jgi:hypothetical protein